MEIIPAIDIMDGACVRLTQGSFQKRKTYHENPVEVALSFEQAGLRRVHIVDLDGARAKKVVNIEVVKSIAQATNLQIDFGGGVQTNEDIKLAFESGAHQVTGGTIAVRNRKTFEKWIQEYGPEKIILGADVKAGKIAIEGWSTDSDLELFGFLKSYMSAGIEYVICTDISKDGLLKGPAFDLYKRILDTFPTLNLIASGGVAQVDDLIELRHIGLYGVIIGKALYEGKITLNDLKNLN